MGKISLGLLFYSLKIDNEEKTEIINLSQSHFLETKNLSQLITTIRFEDTIF